MEYNEYVQRQLSNKNDDRQTAIRLPHGSSRPRSDLFRSLRGGDDNGRDLTWHSIKQQLLGCYWQRYSARSSMWALIIGIEEIFK